MKVFSLVLLVVVLAGAGFYFYQKQQPTTPIDTPAVSADHVATQKIEVPAYSSKIANAQFPEIDWSDLAPQDWDTAAEFAKFDFGRYQDGDPRAEEELKRMQDAFNKAPVQKNMDGKKITLSGYMVPLDISTDAVTEFLLVPFFGACIHVPPPPANQMIYIEIDEGINIDINTAITVQGVLTTDFIDTGMGGSGYQMLNPKVVPYVEKVCMFAPTCKSEN